MKGVHKTAEADWREKMVRLLWAIATTQAQRHTVSLRELEDVTGVSRQTIANWLQRAEKAGYLDLHNGQPRAIQLLPLGQRTLTAAMRGRKRKRRTALAGR